jgi:hypothetical protein
MRSVMFAVIGWTLAGGAGCEKAASTQTSTGSAGMAAPATLPVDKLALTSVEPSRGDADGGTFVRLVGASFLRDARDNPVAPSVKVYFGERQGAVVRFLSNTEMIAQAPAGKPGEVVDVRAMFDGRGELALPHAFTYVDMSTTVTTAHDVGMGRPAQVATSGDLPPACEAYKASIDQLSKCAAMPQQARDAMKQAFDQSSTGWKNLPPAARGALAQACATGNDAVKQALQSCQ